jgi:hypothetical protein
VWSTHHHHRHHQQQQQLQRLENGVDESTLASLRRQVQWAKPKKKFAGKESHRYIQKGGNEILMGVTTLPLQVIFIASSVLAGFSLLL